MKITNNDHVYFLKNKGQIIYHPFNTKTHFPFLLTAAIFIQILHFINKFWMTKLKKTPFFFLFIKANDMDLLKMASMKHEL